MVSHSFCKIIVSLISIAIFGSCLIDAGELHRHRKSQSLACKLEYLLFCDGNLNFVVVWTRIKH